MFVELIQEIRDLMLLCTMLAGLMTLLSFVSLGALVYLVVLTHDRKPQASRSPEAPPVAPPVFAPPVIRHAFTLVELLVVIAIIGVLVGLLLPAVQAARESARRSSCQNNLKQVALASQSSADALRRFPFNGDPITRTGIYTNDLTPGHWSWLARILPFLEQQPLYDMAGIATNASLHTDPTVDPRVRQAIGTTVKTYLCPSDGRSADGVSTDRAQFSGIPLGLTNYKGCAGSNWQWGDWQNIDPRGIYGGDGLSTGNGILYAEDAQVKTTLALVTDGTTNTFLAGEDLPSSNLHCSWPYAHHATGTCSVPLNTGLPREQTAPIDTTPANWMNVYSFRSRHPGGSQFAMLDGSVHFIAKDIDLAVYRALATIDGGEVAPLP
jgi:prepilin-type N-terminal cleavage/methylation domain-containing protein/prepilin-type processing-associated H-X9-DG protein